MARLVSIDGAVILDLVLTGKFLDPFQKDLEWFEYAVSVEGRREPEPEGSISFDEERRNVEGKLNRKEFSELLRGLDDLVAHSRAVRFEPADLNFYFEWSHETPNVFLIVTWFDLALAPRSLEQRFPSAHAGYRFLCDRSALLGFREDVEREFLAGTSARAGRAVQ